MIYDTWKTTPPDEPKHCDCCETARMRVDELGDLIEWIAGHRFYWFATPPGMPVRCALMPYTDTDTVCEAPTKREALEKLWRESE